MTGFTACQQQLRPEYFQRFPDHRVNTSSQKTVQYKNSHFATQLPVDYLYSPSHCWIAQESEGVWRIGFTKFATRMLGEIVDHKIEVEPNGAVCVGQAIGWIEGFKAMSDIFCIAEGEFVEGNSRLQEQVELVNKLPYSDGWLYKVRGKPDINCGNVEGYVNLLDKTIERMLEKQS
ncbi:MAG: glycine cleavage system protein H [Verrucomicrobia bacterium]|nr:glycine cleavage system protein H [Verrucomicrobiota bacterium]